MASEEWIQRCTSNVSETHTKFTNNARNNLTTLTLIMGVCCSNIMIVFGSFLECSRSARARTTLFPNCIMLLSSASFNHIHFSKGIQLILFVNSLKRRTRLRASYSLSIDSKCLQKRRRNQIAMQWLKRLLNLPRLHLRQLLFQ